MQRYMLPHMIVLGADVKTDETDVDQKRKVNRLQDKGG
jgi:hypothetical protein